MDKLTKPLIWRDQSRNRLTNWKRKKKRVWNIENRHERTEKDVRTNNCLVEVRYDQYQQWGEIGIAFSPWFPRDFGFFNLTSKLIHQWQDFARLIPGGVPQSTPQSSLPIRFTALVIDQLGERVSPLSPGSTQKSSNDGLTVKWRMKKSQISQKSRWDCYSKLTPLLILIKPSLGWWFFVLSHLPYLVFFFTDQELAAGQLESAMAHTNSFPLSPPVHW